MDYEVWMNHYHPGLELHNFLFSEVKGYLAWRLNDYNSSSGASLVNDEAIQLFSF